MNKVIMMGRFVKDPEVKNLGERSVATFVMAVDRPFKNKDGERDADFFNFVAWGKAAELIGQSVRKGQRLLVTGRAQKRKYAARDGQVCWFSEIVVEDFDFVEKKNQDPQPPAFANPAMLGTAVPLPAFEEDVKLDF